MNNNSFKIKRDIVPAHLAVKAMRDNGYKNAAYAIAELIDNSIQAGAENVELLCGEKSVQLSNRISNRIHEIAVLDDGKGMDSDLLGMSLQFGNGTHLESETQGGIGKFGMGLPSSSVSQCRKVNVWTWQNGIENAIYSYLDLDEIIDGKMEGVPEPREFAVPEKWQSLASNIGASGTLVVWNDLDRMIWKTANAIIRNSEHVIGRMYRYFLEDNSVNIRMFTYDSENIDSDGIEYMAQANDPMYLLSNTSCPDPFGNKPMFEQYGETREFKIEHDGQIYSTYLRFSYATDEAREGSNPGGKSHGKHAARNQGVSVVRANRELELNDTWVNNYEPTERWWGVEVHFPPGLDDIFGVSNNKQFARNFYAIDIENFKEEGETVNQAKTRLKEEGDPIGVLLDLHNAIESNLSTIRSFLKKQTKGKRSRSDKKKRYNAEKKATELTDERKKEGYHGTSDDDEDLPKDERKNQIEEELTKWQVAREVTDGVIANTFDDGLKYHFIEADMEGNAFFSIKPKGGTLLIKLNIEHPAYSNLVELLNLKVEDADEDELKSRLNLAREGLQLLFMAWARYEDELTGPRKQQAEDVRHDWGRIARQFLERNG